MITMYAQLNSSILSGLTFSVTESRVDEVKILISNLGSLSNQLAHMMIENEDYQNMVVDTMTENLSVGATLSLFFQADATDDISSDLNRYLGIKSVEIEVLP